MVLSYEIEHYEDDVNTILTFGCFAGCCSYVNRGIDY